MNDKQYHLAEFERNIRELVAKSNDPDFFAHNPQFIQGMWTIAHFTFRSKTPSQASKDWFNECVQPEIQRWRKTREGMARYMEKIIANSDYLCLETDRAILHIIQKSMSRNVMVKRLREMAGEKKRTEPISFDRFRIVAEQIKANLPLALI